MNPNGKQETDPEALTEILESDARGLTEDFPEETRVLERVHESKGPDAARKTLSGLITDNPDFAEAISTGEESGSSWSALTLEDAFRELPELEYLTAKDVFPFPSLCCVFDYPCSLKSMSLMYLAVCVATGKPFLGDYEVEQRPVIYLDQENGKQRFSRRVRAFASHFDVNPSDVPFTFYSYPNPPFRANETDSVQRLIDTAQERNAGLILVDNLTTISGDADENSKEMAGVMNGLRRVSEQTEATVLVPSTD